MQAFLATHVLPFRACYACYNVSDAALDKAMAADGGWVPLDPRLLWPYSSGGRDAGRGRPHGLPRMVISTID
ncbi:MAG: hypothetical protein EOS70_08780 [Mesorhizobium sp.]|uniref:hypothetical protein n=1 Tax=Mesorhizobium sp. TaxID=1871066 RepID=UPI000FE81FB8|nr:hypothetical protein [Mesorhizobium sp.]RWC35799.1 MAG: hypothetical protein EOS70_08780 [Mesorhizobium sp.]